MGPEFWEGLHSNWSVGLSYLPLKEKTKQNKTKRVGGISSSGAF
jgi:hypothetical protein